MASSLTPSEAQVEAAALAIQNSIRGMYGLPPLVTLAERNKHVYETHAHAVLTAALSLPHDHAEREGRE